MALHKLVGIRVLSCFFHDLQGSVLSASWACIPKTAWWHHDVFTFRKNRDWMAALSAFNVRPMNETHPRGLRPIAATSQNLTPPKPAYRAGGQFVAFLGVGETI